jgi:hypothetical protein
VRPTAKWLVVGLYPPFFIHQTAQVLKVVVEFLLKRIQYIKKRIIHWVKFFAYSEIIIFA